MEAGSKLATTFQSISDKISSHSGAVQSIVSAGIVTGINQLVELAAFECPCVMEKDLNSTAFQCACVIKENSNATNCSSQVNLCSPRGRSYGYLFIFAPAVLLLFLGFAVNSSFWNKITGCFRNSKYTNKKISYTLIFGNALIDSLIIPITWIMLSLIDGDYLACALTHFPYAFLEEQTCKTPKEEVEKSADYLNNKRYSQILGWSISIGIFFLALIIYGCCRCCQSKNHIYEKINSKCKKKLEGDVTKAFLDSTVYESDPGEISTDEDDKKSSAKFWKNLEVQLSDGYNATKHYENQTSPAQTQQSRNNRRNIGNTKV